MDSGWLLRRLLNWLNCYRAVNRLRLTQGCCNRVQSTARVCIGRGKLLLHQGLLLGLRNRAMTNDGVL
jgi:hypothetical protein